MVHDRFGTSTVRARTASATTSQALAQETYARPGALPDVTPATVTEDLAAPRLHGQRDRDRAERCAAPESWTRLRVALEDLEAGRCASSTSAASSTTRRDCSGSCRYAAGSASHVEPDTLELAHAAIAGTRCEPSAARGSAPSCGCWRASQTRSRRSQTLRALGLDARDRPGFGLDDPELPGRRSHCSTADADAATRPCSRWPSRRSSIAARRLRRCSASSRSTAADRDAILAAATRARAARGCARRAAQRRPRSPIAAGGAQPGDGRARRCARPRRAGARVARAAAPRRARDRWRRPACAAGVPEGPAIGAALRAARLVAKLDGRASGREQELAEALRAAARQRVACAADARQIQTRLQLDRRPATTRSTT